MEKSDKSRMVHKIHMKSDINEFRRNRSNIFTEEFRNTFCRLSNRQHSVYGNRYRDESKTEKFCKGLLEFYQFARLAETGTILKN